MAYIPFSAFDPIFFLHHANIDRLFAMWQALYPDSWIEPTPAIQTSYTTSAGEIQDSGTALTPFYAKSDGTFWTSDMVRDPKVLGYSYNEVAGVSLTGGKSNQRLELQSRVRTAINKLYGGPSPASLTLPFHGYKPGVRIPSSLISEGRYKEWIANVRINKQALGGPFFIHFFLGSTPGDGSTWAFAENLVGTMSVFAHPEMKGMKMGSLTISGTVPLTGALKESVIGDQLSSLEGEDVEEYLKTHLKVGIRTAKGEVIEAKNVPSLHIHIAGSDVLAPEDTDQLPTWQDGTSGFDFV